MSKAPVTFAELTKTLKVLTILEQDYGYDEETVAILSAAVEVLAAELVDTVHSEILNTEREGRDE